LMGSLNEGPLSEEDQAARKRIGEERQQAYRAALIQERVGVVERLEHQRRALAELARRAGEAKGIEAAELRVAVEQARAQVDYLGRRVGAIDAERKRVGR
jgi:hypothetical protein